VSDDSKLNDACLLVHNSPSDNLRDCEPYCLHVYDKDVIVKKPAVTSQHERSKRSDIFHFSDASKRRLLFVCRNSGHKIKSQICLTYHHNAPTDGIEVKKHLDTFLKVMRREYSGLHYLWVFEFQQNGHPHIHFFSDISPEKSEREFIAYHWNRIIKDSSENYLFTSHKNNMFSWDMKSGTYLAKEYLAKSIQKGVPDNFQNVGRFWGNSKNMKPDFQVVQPDDLPELDGFSSLTSFRRSVRILSKQYSKILHSHKIKSMESARAKGIDAKKPKKRNFRNRVQSYALPLCASMFYTLVTGFQPWVNPFT